MIGIDINVRALQLVAVSLALVIAGTELVAVSAAPAPGAAASPPKTVTWYANNRQARARVQLACLDDPGRLINNPDCVNAQQASVTVAIHEGKERTGELDPRKPAFWSDDPANRHNKLLICRKVPKLDYCDVARRSLLIEAGRD